MRKAFPGICLDAAKARCQPQCRSAMRRAAFQAQTAELGGAILIRGSIQQIADHIAGIGCQMRGRVVQGSSQ